MPPQDRERLIATLPQLTAYALALVRGAERARDLVQETALRALGARNIPREPAAFRSWLFAILRNAAIDAFRRERLEAGEPAPPPPIPWPVDDSRIAAITVRQGLAALGPEAREILVLVDVAGFTYAEAAEFLGVPTGTVMSRLSRARAAMLAAIGETTVHPLRTRHGR
ncbi:RNA polymerase sigma factor [Desertibaculum subflavum]|uniref:RNA polymerase sigma factor n=1 Tax=Desertibaculum subflavum TaxID=2268458 RepID=UPI0034D20DC8